MGIMITYGSYVKKDVDLNKAVSQIELMDTGVAFLAGVMIIPVYLFSQDLTECQRDLDLCSCSAKCIL